MHRFFLDVKVAADQCGFYLNTYFDDVDHGSFDVICIRLEGKRSSCSVCSQGHFAVLSARQLRVF